MRRWVLAFLALTIISVWFATDGAQAWTPLSVKQDPLVRMPGTQPVPENNHDIEAPGRCLNCHGGYDQPIEPAFNWQGSMMAQAGRDFLYWSCLTVGAQDSIWAAGRPNATDICLRCHMPSGWLAGNSDIPNGSLMGGTDFDGLHCDFCHSLFDPFFETTYNGTREGNDWLGYWDETNQSATSSSDWALITYLEDARLAATINLFNGSSFYINNLPPDGYTENASGQYFVDDTRDKRASFADANGRHGMFYSRYHKSKYFCSTCHDVSNPVLANLISGGVGANETLADFQGTERTLHTEENSAYSYFHVERTFSEFMLSDYGQLGGAPGMGPYDPSIFETSKPGNVIAACQDCHMRDGVGKACSQNSGVIRPNQSIEHPQSGQPIHDLTGGNAWVSTVLASAVAGSPNYNITNDTLLNQGANVLTLDLGQGIGIDPIALLAGADRAIQQLQLAASINNASLNGGTLTFQVQNQTAHKLISGFPEGRRMFVNIKAYDSTGVLIHEINPYDYAAGTIVGLNDLVTKGGGGYHYPYVDPTGTVPLPRSLEPNEVYNDELVYEMHPTSIDLTGELESFHFALATGRYKDNRIPPKGFRIAEAAARQSVPAWHGVEDPNYFTAAEYAGGYDEVSVAVPNETASIDITLYYQTTSREYIEFLRDEIQGYTNNLGHETLSSPTPSGEEFAYVAQTDPWFTQLAAWGDTIWDLWLNNMDVTTAAPFTMASANIGGTTTCNAPTPTLLSATPASSEVTLTWSDEAGATGYNVYYDQAGKSALIADVGLTTSFIDSGLTNGNEYCYKVTSYDATCESGFSNILCAIPNGQGQLRSGVNLLETGMYVKTGKGKTATTTWTVTSTFAQGDAVTVRAYVVDNDTGLPLQNATVTIDITGPTTTTLTTGPSDANGIAEATWNTQAPNKRGQGGTPTGSYTATTTNVTASGYTWDGVMTAVSFSIQ